MAQSPTITAFKQSPDRGQGLARDMGVRWALEEVAQPYHVRLITFKELKEPGHRAANPFGQIPTYEQGDLTLFESGSIVLQIAETHTGLLPENKNDRARAVTWIFAALSTMEPVIAELSFARLFEHDKPWFQERNLILQDRARDRLRSLSVRLGQSEWLEGQFSAGDLMMINVMRRLKKSGLLNEFPNLADYIARGEARPAFTRAFAAQLAVFEASKTV